MATGNIQIIVTTSVSGRPKWSENESMGVQHLIVHHKLTAPQFRELRKFADNSAGIDQPRRISHSLARALVNRNLADIVNHGRELAGKMSRHHPEVYVRLNENGMKLAVRLGPRDATPEAGA